MVLVVLLHAASWYEVGRSFGETPWLEWSRLLVPLRMPLFFLISGMLAANAILYNKNKVIYNAMSLFTVYVFWSIVSTGKLAVLPSIDPETPYSLSLVIWNILAPSDYWYIWALPVYLLLATALVFFWRDKSRPDFYIYAILAFSMVLALFSGELGLAWKDALHLRPPRIGFSYTDAVLRNFVWFLLGVIYSKRILDASTRVPEGFSAASVAGLALLIIGGFVGSLHEKFALVVAPFPMVFGAILLIKSIQNWQVSKILAFIGHRTLPVYVFHWFMLNILTFCVQYLDMNLQGELWAYFFPPFGAAVIVAACIAVGSIMRAMGLGILFVGLPNWLHRQR